MKKEHFLMELFGTDGIRGKANRYPMTVEIALSVGRSLGKILNKRFLKSKVVIGKDTRRSCYMFENALVAGLCSMGVDTLMLGPFPTPGVAFITRAYRAHAGIVISASHNPYYDNGIKIFTSDGFKLPDEMENEIANLVELSYFEDALPKDETIGKNARIKDADGRYIEFVKATFPKKHSLKGLRVCVDCANGATYKIAPSVFRELDAEVFCYGIEPDGLNINRSCGSLHPENVKKGVIDTKADIGICFDGDGDRVILIDENAQIVDGDVILAICAQDMLLKGKLKNKRVVSTVMSNLGFIQAMKALGIEVIRANVGDRYVIQEMLKAESVLGGEPSGHLIFLEHNTTGDGLIAALQVLKIMIETDKKLSQLAEIVKKFPQVTINLPVKTKIPLENLTKAQHEIARVEDLLGAEGRILVRYSGTENICRIMIEGPREKIIQESAAAIADAVQEEIGLL